MSGLPRSASPIARSSAVASSSNAPARANGSRSAARIPFVDRLITLRHLGLGLLDPATDLARIFVGVRTGAGVGHAVLLEDLLLGTVVGKLGERTLHARAAARRAHGFDRRRNRACKDACQPLARLAAVL